MLARPKRRPQGLPQFSMQVIILAFLFCATPACAASPAADVLKALSVYGGKLFPAFSPSRFDYELDLDDDDVRQQQREEFAKLEQRLTVAPADGHRPSVILAPHVDLNNAREGQQPRIFVAGKEVPCKPAQAGSMAEPHVAVSREDLLASAFTHEGGKHAYSLILVEVHMPVSSDVDPEEDGAKYLEFNKNAGLYKQTYVIRVFGAARATEAQPRQMLAIGSAQVARVPAIPSGGIGSEGFAEVMQSSSLVGIKLTDGRCSRTRGPLHGVPLVSVGGKDLGLYQAESPHIICFGPREQADDDDERFKFVASRFGGSGGAIGQFGFGNGVTVGLRPEVETDALWPLQEGVPSLGVPLRGSSFRVIGLRAKSEAGQQVDLPVVVTQMRQDWPVDVQFVNKSLGRCYPLPGPDNDFRFVCRTEKDIPVDTTAQFLAFCEDCMPRRKDSQTPSTMTIDEEPGPGSDLQGSGRQASASLQVASSRAATSVDMPWAGWTTEVPASGVQRQWTITVQPKDARRLSGSDAAASKPMVFQVLLVDSDEVLSFESVTLDSGQKDKLERAGRVLSQACLVIFTLLGSTALATFVLGLPNRLLAALPSLSAAALSLQLLAIAGNSSSAAEPLRVFAESLQWLAPGSPRSMLLAAIAMFVVVGIAHGAAVCKFIILNGRGSAQALPHGLALGGWELRAVGLLAFPLAAASAAMAVPMAAGIESGFSIVAGCVGSVVLVGLVWLAIYTWSSVSQAIRDENVHLITLPPNIGSGKTDGYPVFVDHFCDQLRAIPQDASNDRCTLFGDWLSTPSWCVKPEVACIQVVEHHGTRRSKPSMFFWTSQYERGPWRAHHLRDRVEDESHDPSLAALPSDYTLYKLGIKRAPSATNAEAIFRQASADASEAFSGNRSVASTTAALWGNGMQNELVLEHPINVKTSFAYEGGHMSGGYVAGIRCLSWINCAVPAATLVKLQNHLQGELAFRTQAGQMSGPVSGGRLAACFDWGVLWPWNWPADLALKVVLGVWVATLSHADSLSPTVKFLLNASALGGSVAQACAVMLFRPYVHIMDNIAMVSARLAVVVAVATCQISTSPFSGDWSSFVPSLVAAAGMTLLPLGVLFVASVVLAFQMFGDVACRGCSQANQAAEELLEKFWKEGREDDMSTIDIGKHAVDVVFQDMHPAPRLPALVRSPVEHLRLQPCPGRRGVCNQLPSSGKPWLSLVPSVLFPSAGNNSRNSSTSRTALPIAALTEQPDDGRLLFAEKKHNGGLEWKEVLHSFIDPIDESCAKEAERLIEAFEFPVDGAGAERTLAIIEMVPADTATMTLIR